MWPLGNTSFHIKSKGNACRPTLFYVFNFQALDFLFFLGCRVGPASLGCLNGCQESCPYCSFLSQRKHLITRVNDVHLMCPRWQGSTRKEEERSRLQSRVGLEEGGLPFFSWIWVGVVLTTLNHRCSIIGNPSNR